MNTLIRELIEFSLPAGYRYVLWAAKSNASLLETFSDSKKPKKNQKYLIHAEKKKTDNPLNSLWSILNLSEEKKHFFVACRSLVIESFNHLQTKLHNLLTSKEDFLLEVYKLGSIINTGILPKLTINELAKSLLWVESNKCEKELSLASLFESKEVEMINKNLEGFIN